MNATLTNAETKTHAVTRQRTRIATLAPAVEDTPIVCHQGTLDTDQLHLAELFLIEDERIQVEGDADGDLDLYIYDRYGVMVACDNAIGGTRPMCSLTALGTGNYLIKAVNSARRTLTCEIKVKMLVRFVPEVAS